MGERTERCEPVIFTNMVMVEDEGGRVLVENKRGSWGGLVFPGGHVEGGEFFTDAAIREVREETGLSIKNPRLVGIKHFITARYRYVVTLFSANEFEGELSPSQEGEVFWLSREELLGRENEMPPTFRRMLDIFFYGAASEYCMMEREDGGFDESFR